MLVSSRPGLKLSIVIAAWNGNASLEACLLSLGPDGRAPDTEVIVASNSPTEALRQRFSYVQFMTLPPGTTVPVLRAAGVRRSAGEIIALAEDHCAFGENWRSGLKKAHELPYAVVGGPVENASVER